MPKYTNGTNAIIMAGTHRFEAGETLEIREWLNPLPAGITKSSDSPFYDPIILSQKVTSTGPVAIPVVNGSYKVRIYVSTGEVSVKFSSSSATAILIGAGDYHEVKCMSRSINSVIFTISSGTAYLTVEKL